MEPIRHFFIQPQYVALTDAQEVFPNLGERNLHLVQQAMRDEFDWLKKFCIITAPTGTGKSYAFPFPALLSKESGDIYTSTKKGLIVLPTNALIDELTNNFENTYSQLKVAKITGNQLNARGLRGFKRYEKILESCAKADLVITNPDILNYIMHGGYHKRRYQRDKNKKTGRREFSSFIDWFSYVIFDEYHLYDEAQIANILTMIDLQEMLVQHLPIKYFFVSATPELKLQTLLKGKGGNLQVIEEDIVESSQKARAIHGKLTVELHCTDQVVKFIHARFGEIKMQLEAKQKVLIILNKLSDVQYIAKDLEKAFTSYTVYQSSGYAPEDENSAEKIVQADIIVATNKAEVGVNYGINYCLMQSGSFFGNFVQRFGRTARGDQEGKIIVCLPEKLNNKKLHRLPIQNTEICTYYQFMNAMKEVIQPKGFYEEWVPYYQGEYTWCILNTMRKHQEWNSRKYFEKRLKDTGFYENGKKYSRFKLLESINQLVYNLKSDEWSDWWKRYLDTYLTFRDASQIVEIVDMELGIELSYSSEWILQYKEILKKESITEKNGVTKITYHVGKLKPRSEELSYEVSTIPAITSLANRFPDYKDIATPAKLQNFFKSSIDNIINTLKRRPVESQHQAYRDKELALLEKVKELGNTFSRKRLKISDVNLKEIFI